MPEPAPDVRALAAEMIERMGLDLTGLTIYTEAASGPYLHTPLLAAAAGADAVLAVTADSPYAAKEEVREATLVEAAAQGVGDSVAVGFGRQDGWLARADIVTNSGFVRPIDAAAIEHLKPTAVVPLMWETWEFREADLDLDACRERGILVLGTDESAPPCDMRPFTGALGPALLGRLGVQAGGAAVALLGGQPLIGGAIREALLLSGAEVAWFTSEPAEGSAPYDELDAGEADAWDALVVAEHSDPRPLVAPGGALDPAALAGANPGLPVGVVCGNVDGEALAGSGLPHAPEPIRPFGEMSFQPADLGPEPVLMLCAAGLKVGEAMARARLGGASPSEAARKALSSSPAQDFPGERAWVAP